VVTYEIEKTIQVPAKMHSFYNATVIFMDAILQVAMITCKHNSDKNKSQKTKLLYYGKEMFMLRDRNTLFLQLNMDIMDGNFTLHLQVL